jgi:hypothetical protein
LLHRIRPACTGRHPAAKRYYYENRRERSMIGYVTLGTKDLKKAAAFYDKIAAEMG